MGRSRTKTLGIVAAILAGAALAVIGVSLEQWRRPTKGLWAKVSVGSTRVSVIGILGEPEMAYTPERAPLDYYIPGYGKRERPISGEVLIYRGADMVFYIWLDPSGKVEEVFHGTS